MPSDEKELKHGYSLPEAIRNECKVAYDIFTAGASDGLIGTMELDRILRMLGVEPSANDLKTVLSEFGEHQGKMDLGNFLDMMERQLLARQKTEADVDPKFAKFLSDCFHLYDKDKDGSITQAEIKTVFSLAGETVTDEELQEIFCMGDRNSDGKLDFDEWIALMFDMESFWQTTLKACEFNK